MLKIKLAAFCAPAPQPVQSLTNIAQVDCRSLGQTLPCVHVTVAALALALYERKQMQMHFHHFQCKTESSVH